MEILKTKKQNNSKGNICGRGGYKPVLFAAYENKMVLRRGDFARTKRSYGRVCYGETVLLLFHN